MLPGVSGTLLAPTFLKRLVGARLAAEPQWPALLTPVHAWWRRVDRTLGPAASVRAIADTAAIPLLEARAYRVQYLEPHDGGFVGSVARADGARVALRVAPWGQDLDREWRTTVRAGRLADARWAIVYAGNRLRIVDAARTWSRRVLEFDLATALANEASAAAFVIAVDAAGSNGNAALAQLAARSEQHGVDVCAALGTGVLEALTAVFSELARKDAAGRDHARTSFEQAVTIVYRLLFLLFAEARALVPTWHHVYRDAYTVDALCRRALLQPSRPGAWQAVQAISRLAQHGCRAGDLVVTPFNGRLFSPRHTPLAERARLSDRAVGRAIVALATTPGCGARERIAYGDLGVEQLGAVYERVLEYEPAHVGAPAPLARTSVDRKSSGSFYTPRSITDFLVRRTLHPLVQGKTADEVLRLRVLDPAMGSGAFLVAACRYLGDVVERALRDEGHVPANDPEARGAIRRLVAQRCLFGVDVNPMAVQLARLSLWLATLSADRPLTFLDHHLATGDSLLGASLHDLAREPFRTPARRATPLPLFDNEPEVALARQILPERFRLAQEPDDSAAAVHAKERALAGLSAAGTPLAQWKDAAHLWCATWFWNATRSHHDDEKTDAMTRGVYRDVLASLVGRGGSLGTRDRDAVLRRARLLADQHRFFHWELEFPEVFFGVDGQPDPDGGFDAVIGNPPWDVLRADSGDEHQRAQSRSAHRATLTFMRHAGIYRHQGGGHVNRYQLFVERALQLLRPGGRLALILPSGLTTDQGCSGLRRALFGATRMDLLFGFDNRRAIFPIHRDVRFLLVTARKGDSTDRVACRFGLSDPQVLDALPDNPADDLPTANTVSLTRTIIEQWDPAHGALPWITRGEDLEILSVVRDAVPPLSATRGWQVRFGRELNATDDRRHFVSGRAASPDNLPVIEGKHLEPFRALVANSHTSIAIARAEALVDRHRSFARSRLAYRDVASATNRLTLIAARLPAGTISTHTVFCSKDTLGTDAQYCLLALLNSLVANYLVRLRVTTHVTTAVMAQLCVPRPASQSAAFAELAQLARALERTGVDGHEDAYARLNAIAGRLYGLSQQQYDYVVSTFPLLSPELRARLVMAYKTLPVTDARPDRQRMGGAPRTTSR